MKLYLTRVLIARLKAPAWLYWAASLSIGLLGFGLAVLVAANPL